MVVATASVSAIVTAARALNMSQKGVCELESVGGTKEVCGRIVQRKFATLAGTVKRKFQVRNNGSFFSVRTASIQTLHGTGIAVSPLSLSLSASLCSHCLLSLSSLSLSLLGCSPACATNKSTQLSLALLCSRFAPANCAQTTRIRIRM